MIFIKYRFDVSTFLQTVNIVKDQKCIFIHVKEAADMLLQLANY
jgi:hypothetical protein